MGFELFLTGPPVLKWPGGKRWLCSVLSRYLYDDRRLIEPFCGGAALFFFASPRSAVLADVNAELINTYQCVRDHPQTLIKLLKGMPNTKEDYYRIRGETSADPVERAARMIYLSRLSFNGIYRVNLRGQYNVPYGYRPNRTTVDPDEICRASMSLETTMLVAQDFEATMKLAGEGDLVYCDPPYTVAHNKNGFLKYNERIFSFEDQERLAAAATEAVSRGATVIVSNADHPSIYELYDGSAVKTVERHSVIGSLAEYRKSVTELIIEVKV